mgnify:CR=1 FL=1
MSEKKGRFITFEGIDGAGKSTHISFVANMLNQAGIKHLITREPGGTPLGETLRSILLHQSMHTATEALLMFAARQEHLERKILPALREGTWVISDRFAEASFAYQGYGKQFPLEKLRQLESWVLNGFQPDMTLLLTLPIALAKQRRENAHLADKFEMEKDAFFQRVQNGYLERASHNPERFQIIDSSQPIETIQHHLSGIIKKMVETSH